MIVDLLSAVFLLAGTLFVFVAALGVVRLPDVPMRMHASTKAGTLGVMLIAIAMVFIYPELSIFARALALVLFMLLTAPVAAHMMGRAAYQSGERMGVTLWEGTIIDQIQDRKQAAAKAAASDDSAADSASNAAS